MIYEVVSLDGVVLHTVYLFKKAQALADKAVIPCDIRPNVFMYLAVYHPDTVKRCKQYIRSR
jgi:hypothetical protein